MTRPTTPLLTVDIIILMRNKIVLIRRKNPPFRGQWALPGGFVELGETVEAAAVREAREETGLEVEVTGLVGVFSDPGRDPRGHTVSVCYIGPGHGTLKASSDAEDVGLFRPDDLPDLAFDHRHIIQRAKDLILQGTG